MYQKITLMGVWFEAEKYWTFSIEYNVFYFFPANMSCDVEEFRCVKSQHCILKSWVCDHEYDCEDGSDEVNCSKYI